MMGIITMVIFGRFSRRHSLFIPLIIALMIGVQLIPLIFDEDVVSGEMTILEAMLKPYDNETVEQEDFISSQSATSSYEQSESRCINKTVYGRVREVCESGSGYNG